MQTLKYETKEVFTDITNDIEVPEGNGFVHIMSSHTTASIRILENEVALKYDMERLLKEFAPTDGFYGHDVIELRDVPPDERKNGFSHLQSLLFNTSEVVPFEDGKLVLGKWQSIFLVELDPFRERKVNIRYICN